VSSSRPSPRPRPSTPLFFAPLTAHLGLSLGDRLCLALARERRLPVLTTERRWLEYDFGVRVEYGR
jgi:PIN domain nuclease of toxin-antitoxin system